jgi:SAM-dependent methyltransferase
MRVKRDFNRVYDLENDPWDIGDATAFRYDRYRELLLAHRRGGVLLDIGSGLGAFLARFSPDFETLIAVETAGEAVRRGRELRPHIRFVHSSAEHIAQTELDAGTYDAIIVSDVLCYLRPPDRTAVLSWVADHLNPGGHALVAGWCPGGRYPEPDEFRALVRSSLQIVADDQLDSDHVVFVTRPKLRLAAFVTEPVPGTLTVPAGGDPERLARDAESALPRELSPERLRLRRRLERLHLLPKRRERATGDELVSVVGERTDAAAAALERRRFRVVTREELAKHANADPAGRGLRTDL